MLRGNELSLTKLSQDAPNVNVWTGASQPRSRKGAMDRILQARGTNPKIYVPEKWSGIRLENEVRINGLRI